MSSASQSWVLAQGIPPHCVDQEAGTLSVTLVSIHLEVQLLPSVPDILELSAHES